MVGKEPVTPDSLKQQTLDSRVKKTKHGRNIAKKLDNTSEPKKLANGSKPVVKEEVDNQTENRNENARRKQHVTTTAGNLLSLISYFIFLVFFLQYP